MRAVQVGRKAYKALIKIKARNEEVKLEADACAITVLIHRKSFKHDRFNKGLKTIKRLPIREEKLNRVRCE
jgi:hypothetical protein